MPKTPYNPFAQQPSKQPSGHGMPSGASYPSAYASSDGQSALGPQDGSSELSGAGAQVAVAPQAGEAGEQAPRQPRVPAQVGVFGLVLVVAVVSNAVLGALWGALRPGFESSADADGNLTVSPDFNVAFSAFAVFLLCTSVVAVLSVVVAIWQSVEATSLGMLFWLGIWNFVGAHVFLVCGDLIVAFIRNADVTTPDPGQSVRVIPWVAVGVSGAVWSAFIAMAVYWSAMLITLPKQQDAVAQDELPDFVDADSAAGNEVAGMELSAGQTPFASGTEQSLKQQVRQNQQGE